MAGALIGAHGTTSLIARAAEQTIPSTSRTTTYHHGQVDAVGIFYREAGRRDLRSGASVGEYRPENLSDPIHEHAHALWEIATMRI
jgi:hypothetical protein